MIGKSLWWAFFLVHAFVVTESYQHDISSLSHLSIPTDVIIEATLKDTLMEEEQMYQQAHQYWHDGNLNRAAEMFEAVIKGTMSALTSDHHRLATQSCYYYAEMLRKDIAPHISSTQALHVMLSRARDLLGQYAKHAIVYEHDRSTILHAYNTMGLLSIQLDQLDEAMTAFQQAIQVDQEAIEPLGNLVLVSIQLGRLEDAIQYSQRALDRQPTDWRLMYNMGVIYNTNGLDKNKALEYWQQALRLNPKSVDALTSIATLLGHRGNMSVAQQYLQVAEQYVMLDHTLVDNMSLTIDSVRLQRTVAHLELVYLSVEELYQARQKYQDGLASLLAQSTIHLPLDLQTTIGTGSMGYYAIYQAFSSDLQIRAQLAHVYQRGASQLEYVAPHIISQRNKTHIYWPSSRNHNHNSVYHPRRIRLGFHSAFLRHHSVGLLLSNVIIGIDQRLFEIYVITYDNNPIDHVTQQVLSILETPQHHVVLSALTSSSTGQDLKHAQQQIAALQLDVLVFSEIGMEGPTYFLAFSRLALRTAVFWGHAITSGIDTIDYFISSKYFRLSMEPMEKQQERYSECVYEMNGLTAIFSHPPSPNLNITRESLGLPPPSILPLLVLVPQTLYKLHPDFDPIIQQVLSTIPHAYMVFPIGNKPILVERLTQRWRQHLRSDVYRRIYFVRSLNTIEYMTLCHLSDLVLDPFPVGGGRSSFEVFSTGTPIIGLRSRTTILQLTFAMYQTMGLNASFFLLDHPQEMIDRVIQLLRNDQERYEIRHAIQVNKYKLYREYEDGRVASVIEWQDFITTILAIEPPISISSADFATGRVRRIEECPHYTATKPPFYSLNVNIPGMEGSHEVRLESIYDDPFQVAQAFTTALSAKTRDGMPVLDVLQITFLGKLMWNMQSRWQRKIVETFTLEIPHAPHVLTLEIRQGDDLHQQIRWEVSQQLASNVENRIREEYIHHLMDMVSNKLSVLPMTDEWLMARQRIRHESSHNVVPRAYNQDCVALVITTCKRFPLFERTIESLRQVLDGEWHTTFCQVLVIDDNSSDQDREKMKRMYPSFTYYFKSPEEKGHAKSLNLALGHVTSRFLFYVEDDWEFYPSKGLFIQDSVHILNTTSLVQIMINDQQGGWPRHTYNNDRLVRYALHEFAVLEPTHTFAYWPGFSLNPGVWDLSKLSLIPSLQTFDEQSDIFERLYSLQVWEYGQLTGFLKQTYCTHIGAPPGTNASAYVLNGLPRRFD